jgi:hypothetical protein
LKLKGKSLLDFSRGMSDGHMSTPLRESLFKLLRGSTFILPGRSVPCVDQTPRAKTCR